MLERLAVSLTPDETFFFVEFGCFVKPLHMYFTLPITYGRKYLPDFNQSSISQKSLGNQHWVSLQREGGAGERERGRGDIYIYIYLSNTEMLLLLKKKAVAWSTMPKSPFLVWKVFCHQVASLDEDEKEQKLSFLHCWKED